MVTAWVARPYRGGCSLGLGGASPVLGGGLASSERRFRPMPKRMRKAEHASSGLRQREGPEPFYFRPLNATSLVTCVNWAGLLLLALQSGHEHLLGPLGSPLVVLKDPVEELHELLVAFPLSILDVGL